MKIPLKSPQAFEPPVKFLWKPTLRKLKPCFSKVKAGRIENVRALILDTEKGTVVIFGYAHRDSSNPLNHVVQLTGKKKIHAVMSGLHLLFAYDEKLKKVADCIRDFGIEKMVIGLVPGLRQCFPW